MLNAVEVKDAHGLAQPRQRLGACATFSASACFISAIVLTSIHPASEGC
jgi:hypothetical protein